MRVEDAKGDPQVHAVLILKEPGSAADVVRATNAQVASHQQIRGFSVWPDDDFPRTPTLKVKKAQLAEWVRAELSGRDESAEGAIGRADEDRLPIERLVARLRRNGVRAAGR